MNTELAQALAKSQLFTGCNMEHLQGLEERFQILRLQPNHVLLEPGRFNAYLYVLLEGELRVTIARNDAEHLSIVLPGEYVGEISLLDGQTPSAFVITRSVAVVVGINKSTLMEILSRSHSVCMNLMRGQAERFRRHAEMLTAAQNNARRFRAQAETDTLTGLHNRAWFMDVMRTQLNICENANQSVTLAVLDVDHFKRVNDTWGHPVGDSLLKAVADALKTRLRTSDFLARFGGEEFIAVMTGANLVTAIPILNEVRKGVQAIALPVERTEVLSCTISIGAAEFAVGETLDALISRADQALYCAKNSGRNQVQVST